MPTEKEVFSILEDIMGNENINGIYTPDTTYAEDCPIYCNSDLTLYIDNFYDRNDYQININFGATRLTIIPSNKDYVIKIQIAGTYDLKQEILNNEDEDIEDIFYKNIYNSDCVEIVSKMKSTVNLMEIENIIYKKAGIELKKMLLPNTYIGEFNGMKIYIQKKLPYVGNISWRTLYGENDDHEIIDKEIDKIKFICPFISESLIEHMIKIINKKFAIKILMDCKYLNLTDIRPDNYGYDDDNFPYIFDYAGFDFSFFE